MSEQESLNKRLQRLRKEKKLSAKAMALLIDVPASTYREWEYGRGMKLPPFQKISQVLAISVTELVIGEKPNLISLLDELAEVEAKLAKIRLKLGSEI